MNQGLKVYVEIPLNIPPVRQQRITLDDKGRIRKELKIKTTSKIDLVTVSSNGFVKGYEIKVIKKNESISLDQLLDYARSGYFNEIYFVVPENMCSYVLGGYEHYLSSNGIGLLCVNIAQQRVNVMVKPKQLNKYKTLHLRFNEAWIKHMVMTHLRSQGYCVYSEILIPKPLNTLPRIAPLQSNPQRYLNRIDLIAIGGDCTPCDIACDVCEGDVVGIEVKYGKSRLSSNELQKLRDYLGSGVISKMYLVLDNRSNVNSILGQVKGLVDVLVADPLSRSMIFRYGNVAPTKPRFCAFVFESPSGNKLHVYSYCNLCQHIYDVPIPYTLSTWSEAASYVVNIVSRLCQKNGMCLYPSCGRIIYVRRTRSSHVLQVI